MDHKLILICFCFCVVCRDKRDTIVRKIKDEEDDRNKLRQQIQELTGHM